MIKFILYIFSAVLVLYSFSGLNINFIFKKGEVAKARLFSLILIFILTYLLGSFLYDFIYIKLI